MDYICRHATECLQDCNHKTPHEPFKDGGCLPCHLHTHVCLDKNNKYIPNNKFYGRCFPTNWATMDNNKKMLFERFGIISTQ